MLQKLDLAEAVARSSESREAAWEFVSDFAAVWLDSALRRGDGYRENEIGAAEEKLATPLPRALKDAFMKFGRRSDLVRSQERLLAPWELHFDDTGEVLIFRVENQGAAEWGIPVDRLRDEDPATVYRLSAADRESSRWVPWIPRSSLAFVELILWESLFAGSPSLRWQLPFRSENKRSLESGFRRLDFPDFPDTSIIVSYKFTVRWYAGEGAILCLLEVPGSENDEYDPWTMADDGCGDLFIRARTHEAMHAARLLCGVGQ